MIHTALRLRHHPPVLIANAQQATRYGLEPAPRFEGVTRLRRQYTTRDTLPSLAKTQGDTKTSACRKRVRQYPLFGSTARKSAPRADELQKLPTRASEALCRHTFTHPLDTW